MLKIKLVAPLIALTVAPAAQAHNAGTDKISCHRDNSKIGFHCDLKCSELSTFPVVTGEVVSQPVQASAALVYATQLLLRQVGIDVGDADGIFGPRTHAGVAAFQSGAGLPVDGHVDERLIAQLATVGQCEVEG